MIKNERGFTLIEVMIALALLGIIAIAFLMALSTASKALFIADERTTAESLARSQMEYIKSCNYTDNLTQYGIDPNLTLDGYTILLVPEYWDPVSGNVSANETGIQKITVAVSHHGEPVLTLEDYKVDR